MTDDARDESLFRRAQRGDESAFRLVFERHQTRLLKKIDRKLPPRLRRKVSSADVLQETEIVAFRRCLDFEDHGDGSFRKWVDRIAELKLKEAIRFHAGTAKRAAQREVTRGHRQETGQLMGHAATPSQEAVAAELARLADEALATLPEDYQEVLRLTRQQQLTLREAGERMGRSREAVKKLYARALVRFKAKLDELQGGADSEPD